LVSGNTWWVGTLGEWKHLVNQGSGTKLYYWGILNNWGIRKAAEMSGEGRFVNQRDHKEKPWLI
jgi:hypothetical protein